MREKYESLSLATLKDLAKARGLKGISTLRKPELIERMLQEDEKDAQKSAASDSSAENDSVRAEESRPAYESRRRTQQEENHRQGGREEVRRFHGSQDENRRSHGSQDENRRNYSAQQDDGRMPAETAQLDSGEKADGILEVLPDGYGFIRCEIGRAHV